MGAGLGHGGPIISGNGRAGYTRSCSPNCRIFLSLATTLAVAVCDTLSIRSGKSYR